MLKGKIYTVSVKVYYDIYESYWFKEKFLKSESQINENWSEPIFARTEDEAIEKYISRNNYNNCPASHWYSSLDLYSSSSLKETKREVVVVSDKNNYTFDTLKEKMNSQDFLEYCRQELIKVNEIIN